MRCTGVRSCVNAFTRAQIRVPRVAVVVTRVHACARNSTPVGVRARARAFAGLSRSSDHRLEGRPFSQEGGRVIGSHGTMAENGSLENVSPKLCGAQLDEPIPEPDSRVTRPSYTVTIDDYEGGSNR